MGSAIYKLHGGVEGWAGWAMAHPGGQWPTQNFGCVGHKKTHNAFGPTNNWPVYLLILKKISKIGDNRCQILRLKCTNLLSGGAPLGELQHSLDP